MPDDFIINPVVSNIAVAGAVSKKPNYLIVFETAMRSKKKESFITLDTPEFLNGFIHARGFYCDLDEKKIMENYSTILTEIPKELHLDMYFPWHKISNIKNLVFKSK